MQDIPRIPEEQVTPDVRSADFTDRKLPDTSTPMAAVERFPPGIPVFRPKTGLGNGHAQTLYGALRPRSPRIDGTVQRRLRFADGDVAILHDDQPADWGRGGHVALLMHGLTGCYESGYMVRVAAKLLQKNVRVFRMDHRGCGAGRMLAKHPCHAGQIRDVEAAIRMLERLCPGSPVSIAGFSLSGSLLLRYLGEDPESLPLSLFRAVAICPPIDLKFDSEKLQQTRMGQRYDWYFARRMVRQVVDTPQWRDNVPLAAARRPPRRIVEFDEQYTAPASGFDSVEHYYAHASAMNYVSKVRVHTSVLVAEDDPLASAVPWSSVSLPANISLCLTSRGGHLGFISGGQGTDADNRWMDWRVVDWLLH